MRGKSLFPAELPHVLNSGFLCTLFKLSLQTSTLVPFYISDKYFSMKGKRQKLRKKTLLFYKNYFGFKPPYSVLLDGTFCKAALQTKINIMEQLPKYLDAEVKYFTTSCVLGECEALGKYLCSLLGISHEHLTTSELILSK